ncbi:saccharopine dehydrogenase NADP-binding domain-containing protein [Dysgonomonas sp. HGC4]|uniref:saccharopine dehydrogenase NADP-binding domain-containing protein n=1 Tax=Dysgonomonas sp. HGC4 TaxID=1658009 RepID=UPI0006807032|nr:hypothetical protein [Dysgonomonas sp. HGC4]MBD8346407.1 saccharopine dehydrogenase [Dysgonomonas sp. HGC4]
MQKNILIVGGTGHIGSLVNRILKDRNPSLQLFIGSRNKECDKLPHHVYIDVTDISSLSNISAHSINLVILSTIDTDNNVLQYCINKHIDYLDVTKPTPDIQNTLKSLENKPINSRIVFASGWMGGIASGLISALEPDFSNIEQVQIMIYYSLNDKAGKSAADFMAEDVCKTFSVYKNNLPLAVKHFENSENYQFPFQLGRYKVYNFNIPDLLILNKTEKIPSVSAKITYNSKLVSFLLRTAQALNVFKLLSLESRKKLFQSSGSGDKTAFDVIITDKRQKKQTISILCTKGQAELTAFSIALHAEKLFTADNDIYFGHQIYKAGELYELLKENKDITIEKR